VFVHHNRAMQVFLETERLLLRRFTEDDLENLVELDSDPEVMRFITGGRATPREEVENEILPTFLDHYECYAGYGFWAAVEKSTQRFLGWFHFRPADGAPAGEVERVPPRQIRLGKGLRHGRLASVDR
jgi:RimJ/RimL family protein N-acetyltransferase